MVELDLPEPGVTPGPTWAVKLVVALQALNSGKVDTATAAELIRDTMAAALVPGENVTITVNDAGDTITIAASGGGVSAPDASTTVKGIVELATAGETTTGTDGTRAVTPAGLKVELDKKAALASPQLTGNPTAPTPATTDSDTTIATTAHVHNVVDARIIIDPADESAYPDGTVFLYTS